MTNNNDEMTDDKAVVTSSIWEVGRKLLPAIVAAIALLFSGVAGIFAPVTETKQLTVVGSLLPAGDHLEVRGRVLQDGDAVGKALVWVIVEDMKGHRGSPPSTQTDENGGFSVAPVPNALGTDKDKIVEATIYARKEVPASAWYRSATTLRGEDRVQAAGTVSQEAVELSPLKLLPLPAIFFISAMLPFFGSATPLKHVFAVILAFLFTGSMIVYLSLGLKYVNTIGKQDDILALGFASVYQGTYVKDVQPEWLFSFTAPPAKAPEPALAETKPAPSAPVVPSAQPASTPQANTKVTTSTPSASTAPASAAAPSSGASALPVPTVPPAAAATVDHGFGAPLWVLLVSVLGAGVLTVGLVVGEISEIPNANQPDEIRKRLQAIVQHQFFILFAPVGAIFVYQLLVVGSAATSTFTVARWPLWERERL